MKYRVEITPTAEGEIEKSYCYIREKSAENAIRWRKKLYELAGTLSLGFLKAAGLPLKINLSISKFAKNFMAPTAFSLPSTPIAS